MAMKSLHNYICDNYSRASYAATDRPVVERKKPAYLAGFFAGFFSFARFGSGGICIKRRNTSSSFGNGSFASGCFARLVMRGT